MQVARRIHWITFKGSFQGQENMENHSETMSLDPNFGRMTREIQESHQFDLELVLRSFSAW